MGTKVRSREELLENKEQIINDYNAKRSKSKKFGRLTKKEKKILGIGSDEGRATLKYARISSRKAKIVIDLIKNKNIEEAIAIVQFTPKAVSEILYKLLISAASNAVDKGLDRDLLYVHDAFANQGPTQKRIMPRAQGRAYRIKKRSSHITIVLKENNR